MYNILLLTIIMTFINAIGFLVSGVTSIVQAFASWPGVKPEYIKYLHRAIIIFLIVGIVFGFVSIFLVVSQKNTIVTATSSSTPSATITSAHASDPPSPTPTATSANYSAPHPGPGCDTGKGTWTMQGFSPPFTCDTELSVTSSNTRAYLFFHLPKDEAFSPNNRIGITGIFVYMGQYCFGLDEQDANIGYLGEYCNSGEWSLYTISSAGVITGTLKQGISPSPGVNVQFSKDIALTLQGATLTFSIGGSEMYNVTISPIQPVSVAITYLVKGEVGGTPSSMTVNNFGYTVVSS